MRSTARTLLFALPLVLVTWLAPVQQASAQQAAGQAGDAARGAVLSDTCMGCHGIKSYRNAYPSYRVPKLGGQNADYVVIALQGYKGQARPHNTMHAQAASMSDQDMRDVAAYFASQGAPQTAAKVETGVGERVATCAACHGEAGISAASNWPNLAGQHRDYLEHSIRQYKSGARKDPVMGAQAQQIKDEDIAAIAAYFAAQSGLYTVSYTGK
jgi:cytochrome c553